MKRNTRRRKTYEKQQLHNEKTRYNCRERKDKTNYTFLKQKYQQVKIKLIPQTD